MADWITPDQAKSLQDSYNKALQDANKQNQQYQDAMKGTPGTTSTTGATGATTSPGYSPISASNQAQNVTDNSYRTFMYHLQDISNNTGVTMGELVDMASKTPGYGTWENGQLVIRDPNTGKIYRSNVGTIGNSTPPGTGIIGGSLIAGGQDVDVAIPSFGGLDLDRTAAIKAMYDAQIESQRLALQESGDQALSDAQANRDNIASLYQTQRNAASVDWERQRRNFLEGATSSGLNTGAGSQAELSMMGMYQRAQNGLGASQAQAESEADRNIADIKRNTQAAINEAIAKNDYQKAAALLDEYNNMYNRYVERAEALASYGDFTGYAALYGSAIASQMFYNWAAQNPALAYQMGAINQQQYNNLMMGYPINASGTVTYTGAATGSGGNGLGIPSDYTAEKYPGVWLELAYKNGEITEDQYNAGRKELFA